MSSYLVVKRIREDRTYLPGEMLVDPPAAAILMERGFLLPVPDNFVPPPADPIGRAVFPPDTAVSSGEEGELTLDSLMELSRKDLNELAASSGVETPEELANKRVVAQAILDAAAAQDEEPDPVATEA